MVVVEVRCDCMEGIPRGYTVVLKNIVKCKVLFSAADEVLVLFSVLDVFTENL